MPDKLPSEVIQRASLVLAQGLRPWIGGHAPEAGDPQSWVSLVQRTDKLNGRPHRRYSLDDPRFLLRLLIQEWQRFDHRITHLHGSYAREIQHHLNVCAHEPLKVTAADADRAVDTMELLLESLGLPEAAAAVARLVPDQDARAPHAEDRNGPVPPAEETEPQAGGAVATAPEAPEPETAVAEETLGAQVAEDPAGTGDADEVHEGIPSTRDDLPPGTREAHLAAGPLAVTVLYREAVNYALVNNGVSPLLEMRVRNTDAEAAHVLEQLVLVLDDGTDDMGTPCRVPRLSVGAGEEVLLDGADVAWPLDHKAFAALDEARTVSLRINATVDGSVSTETTGIRLLARDEWYARSIPELLAAFITPNAAGVQQLLVRASELLVQRTSDPSLDGYQGGPERALQIGAAVYDALVSYGIRYSEPPASFESSGQKIRPVDTVLAERWGTCLDLTVAYAAALEQAGLNPVVVRAPGHAFAGFLTEDAQLPELALTDRGIIQNFVRGGLLQPVETTAVVEGRALPFEDARSATAVHWDVEGVVLHVLDVAAAHRRIRPLPRVRQVDGGVVIEVVETAPAPLPPPSGPRPRAGTPAAERESYPPRVRKWRSALLDLSLRNPLLKLKKTGAVPLTVPERTLPDFEDQLAAGTVLRLHSGDDLSDIAAAQGKRSAAELSEATLDAILRTERTVHAQTTQARHDTVLDGLRRKAKVVLEETGANNLFITLGALAWKDKQGKEALAPLFLVPVVLSGRKNQPFKVQVEEGAEAQPNFCLIEKLRQDHGLEIPVLSAPPADDSGMDIASVFEEIRRTMARHSLPFTVVPDVRLAMLQFSTLEMWRDLSTNWESFLDNPVVRHLVETPTAAFMDPVPEPEVDERDEATSYLPVPTDGSQLRAVRWATAGRTFVLEGPPGTGKSQTITNMVADNLAAGRTVLFVAEKQAALQVVRDRLEKVGLGPLTLELHGRQQSIKNVREQLARSWDTRTRSASSAFGVLRDQHAGSVADLSRYPRALHRPTRGRSVWQANQELLALRAAQSEADAAAAERIEVPGSLVAQPERAEAAVRTAAALETSLPLLGHRPDDDEWTLAGPEQATGELPDTVPLRPVGALLDALRALDERVVGLLRTTDDLGRWRVLVAWLREVDAGRAMAPAEYRTVVTDSWHQDVRAFLADAHQVLSRHGRFLQSLDPAALTTDLTPHRLALEEAQGRLFGKKKALRAAAQTLQPFVVVADAAPVEDAESFVAALHALQYAEQDLRQRAQDLLPDGRSWSLTLRDPIGAVESVLARAEALAPVLAAYPGHDAALTALLGTAADSFTGHGTRTEHAERGGAFVDAWTAALEFLGATEASVRRWRGGAPLADRLREAAPVWQAQVDRERDRRLRSYRLVDGQLQELEDAGFASLARELRAGTASVAGLSDRLRRAVAEEVLTDTLEEANLTSFDASVRDRQVETYLELSGKVRRSMRTALPAQVLTTTGINRERPTREQAEFNRLIHQKRGGSIREIMERTGSVLQELTPCLLMSPHSVSKYLPAGAMSFDVVIFDEASQIRVADSIGAMGRSKAVVVVGDSQQMPPTSMFSSAAGDDDDEDTEDGLTVADQDSILTEAVDSNVQSLGLTWHYRSQDESLIAFSNRRYYRGELSSFPAPPERRPGLGVSWERVDGEFDGGQGGTRTNEVEAQRIVDEVVERLREDPGASIGVVTFNTQQRDLVLDKLEQSEVPAVQDALVRGEDPLFVKNLENVQGDERDVILFSLAFSRNRETGTLRLNFGPLTTSGGQRRLNVAITRARRAIKIISSFGPEDLDLSRTSSEGLRHLREYMVFARDHGRDDAHTAAHESWDLHRQDVAAALRAAGLEVAEDIGMSNFRVDLAARFSPDHEWVAVLLDGPAWARRAIVSDRDAIPTQVLTGAMGWRRIEQVWLPSWIRSRSAVVEEILGAARSALKQPEEPPAPPVGETPEPDSRPEAEEATVPEEYLVPTGAPADRVTGPPAGDSAERVRTAPPLPAPAPPVLLPPGPPQERDETLLYLPAPFREAGTKAVLDDIAAPRHRTVVRENLEEIVAAEGPVEAQRLARLLGNRFGMQRVQAARQEAILGCLPKRSRTNSVLGTFYWPEGLSPEEYTGYRRTPPGGEKRAVTEIAPEEIGNAVLHCLRREGPCRQDDIFQVLNDVFGFNRTGREIRERYARVLERLERDRRIVRDEAGLVLLSAG